MADYTLKTRAEALKKNLEGLDKELANIAKVQLCEQLRKPQN